MKNCEGLSELLRKIGKNIKKIRVKKGMTIKELSIKTGIKESYLIKIELGHAHGFRIENHAHKISHALNITLRELFTFK